VRPTVLAHVRRYPWWYGALAVWLVAMLALPVVELDPLAAFRDEQAAPNATATTSAPAPGFAPGGGELAGPSVGGEAGATDEGAAGDAVTTTTAPSALELVPPEVLDLVFDAIPPIEFPPLPEELATLAAAIAPIATTGCSGLGLASLVVAVVAQTVEGVPLGRLLPYLAPVSTACASFPIPEHHTECAADEPLVIDLGGLTETPPILGLGIDQLDAIETLMADTFGIAAPRLAPELRTMFDCRLVSRADAD
jgi:hypothetical protein